MKMVLKKDILIISHLRNNSRDTLTKLSKKTNIPISTIHDKLRKRCSGIISKNTLLVDFSKIGFHCRAYIILRVNKKQRHNIKEFLLKEDRVNSLFKIDNGYDFLIDGVFKDMADLEFFMEKLDSKFDIKEKKVHHIIKNLKQESFLSNPEFARVFD